MAEPTFDSFAALLRDLTSNAHAHSSPALSSQLHLTAPYPQVWSYLPPLLALTPPQPTQVRFFVALVLVGKIKRDAPGDWPLLDVQGRRQLVEMLKQWVRESAGLQGDSIVRKKLAQAVTALSFRMAHLQGEDEGWRNWMLDVLTPIQDQHALLEILSVMVEEIVSCDLVGGERVRYDATVMDALPLVTRILVSSLTSPLLPIRLSALKCLDSLLSSRMLTYDPLTTLFSLLGPLLLDGSPTMNLAASCLCEFIATNASATFGMSMGEDGVISTSGQKNPLVGFMTPKRTMEVVEWMGREEVRGILRKTIDADDVGDGVRRELTKLLVALLDHCIPMLAHTTSHSHTSTTSLRSFPLSITSPSIEELLKDLLAVASTEGYGGVDEEVSELTAVIFESLGQVWAEEGEEDRRVIEGVFMEWIRRVVVKVRWPDVQENWSKDEVERFTYYRRDLEDALVQAYCVLRDLMLTFFIDGIEQQLSSPLTPETTENVEAALFCISSIHDVISPEDTCLSRLFGPACFGNLPPLTPGLTPTQRSSIIRLRNTALVVIENYAFWISRHPSFALPAVSFVAPGLSDGHGELAPASAKALISLCKHARGELVKHVDAFGSLVVQVEGRLEEQEYTRVLEAVASVLQSMLPEQRSHPVGTLVNPILEKLSQAVKFAPQHAEATQKVVLASLRSFSAIIRGLRPSEDDDFEDVLDLSNAPDPDDKDMNIGGTQGETKTHHDFTRDITASNLRAQTITILQQVLGVWKDDLEVAVEVSGVIKWLIPEDGKEAETLLVLEPDKALALIAHVLRESETTVIVWMTLLGNLVGAVKRENPEVVVGVVQGVLEKGMRILGQGRSVLEDVDLLLSFMTFVKETIKYHAHNLISLPTLSPLVFFCLFVLRTTSERLSITIILETLILLSRDTHLSSLVLSQHGEEITRSLVRGMVGGEGSSGVFPRSTLLTLGEAVHAVMKGGGELARRWLKEAVEAIAFAVQERERERFVKNVAAARTTKKVRDAVGEFVLVARGLSNTGYGIATS